MITLSGARRDVMFTITSSHISQLLSTSHSIQILLSLQNETVSTRSTCEVLFGVPYGTNEHCLGRSPQSLLRLKRNALRIRQKGQSLSTANTHTNFVGTVFVFQFRMSFCGEESICFVMGILSLCCKYEFQFC
jgi:hypothetical protein